MKKTVAKDVHCCDACGAEQDFGMDACLKCGAEHCFNCKKTHGKEYQHGIYVGGSGDGYYCNACDTELTASGADRRHAAYQAIARLRNELKAWSEDFKRRANEAEQALENLP